MGERKVINKYYPPDFDPALLPRGRKPKNSQITVRVMLPMTCCCERCGEYIYKGKKFNSRKETVIGEEYLGIKIFRFYIKCPRCSAELTFKTDPKNSDYTAEFGLKRNFEPWRPSDLLEAKRKEREVSEDGDTMKALENKTIDSKQEMDILDALDEIRALNARTRQVDTDKLLEDRIKMHEENSVKCNIELDSDDEALVDSLVFENSEGFIRRVDADDVKQRIKIPAKRLRQDAAAKKPKKRKLFGVKVVKAAESNDDDNPSSTSMGDVPTSESAGALGSLAAYGSDSDSA